MQPQTNTAPAPELENGAEPAPAANPAAKPSGKMAPPRQPDSLAGRARRLFAQAMPKAVIVRRGPTKSKAVALTFDDGPHELTDAYLDVLDRYDARATFFVIGKACVAHPDGVRRIVARGHEVAGHGYEHIAFPKLDGPTLEEELARTAALLPPPRTRRPLVRPPTGRTTPTSLARVARAGYSTVLWSRDSDDCRTKDPAEIVARLAPEALTPGEIILLHECQTWTLEALPAILENLMRAGWSMVPVGELADL
jgi:peptidoglycan/xylan/chitin deacetylase (PgdA/CDA1 family)